MKKAIRSCLIGLVLLTTLLVQPVWASGNTTTLTIEYHATHSFVLCIHGRGSVQIGETVYSRSESLTVPHLSAQKLVFMPTNGGIRSITCNGIVQPDAVQSGVLELDKVTEDLKIEVWFTSNSLLDSLIPNTGDTIFLPVIVMTLSAALLLLLIGKRKKP